MVNQISSKPAHTDQHPESTALSNTAAPHLIGTGSQRQLIVDGAPFLIRGGELSNSGAERPYLTQYWPKLVDLGLNTIVAPVFWDVVEPVEGQFNWRTLDELLEDARSHDMRLVILWFGSWKNSTSSHAPAWVKRDFKRFPRVRTSAGAPMEILTPFSTENRDADARAFAAMMAHLRVADPQHTVVMVQVENEIGMIVDARDHCDLANQAFQGPVPNAMLPEGHAGGTWPEVFGASPATDELFMAWAFGQYVSTVAATGKAELDLPMYTNAALIRPAMEPGQYPSAGPLPHLAWVWKLAAPAIDFISPDIYFKNFADWASAYVDSGNPLFVPEALRSNDASVNALFAFGKYGAIGFSPFGIESIADEPASYLTGAYELIKQLTPYIAEHAFDGNMAGLIPPSGDMRHPQRTRIGDVVLNSTYEQHQAPELSDGVINETGAAPGVKQVPSVAIVIKTGPEEFLIAGIGVTITFSPAQHDDGTHSKDIVGIISAEEGHFDEAGNWVHTRWLNGDQTHQGRHIRLEPGRFAIQKVELYRYQ